MINRWVLYFICLCTGAGLGYGLIGREGAVAGLVVGPLVWLAVDSFYLGRLLRWLRVAQNSDELTSKAQSPPTLAGVWGEMSERVCRIIRQHDSRLANAQVRLDEFLAAMQASPGGVVLLDAEDRIEWCNHMATQHFGFDAQRDVSQHIANLVRAPGFKTYMASNDFSHDVVIPGSASQPGRPVNLSVHAHAYGNDRKLLLSRDITAVELAEAMRRDFVANVSHEIRTPLTVLSGFIETLQTLALNEADRTRYLVLMAQQSQRMQTLVNDLLTLSRLEGSPRPGASEWVACSALMAQCEQEARALSRVLTTLGHRLMFEADTGFEIAGVQAELFSALSNLVTNAVRYTSEGGQVHVSWKVLGDGRGRFMVHDTGPGIAPEHLPRLTERFYRVDRSRSRETGGTGLGLAIVKHVAQRHGAELQMDSVIGHGSKFSITFPSSRVRHVALAGSVASQAL